MLIEEVLATTVLSIIVMKSFDFLFHGFMPIRNIESYLMILGTSILFFLFFGGEDYMRFLSKSLDFDN